MSNIESYKSGEIILATIDAQRCFMPLEVGEKLDKAGFGELPVEGGHEIVPVLNNLNGFAIIQDFDRVTTQDWHPSETAHFGEGEMQWPVHGVAGTKGAELHPHLKVQYSHHGEKGAIRYKKGQEPIDSPEQDDSYSGYNAIDSNGETLAEYANRTNKRLIIIGGLALGGAEFETCVDSTALDFANKSELDVIVVEDACRAINPDEMVQIKEKLEASGVRVVKSYELINGQIINIER